MNNLEIEKKKESLAEDAEKYSQEISNSLELLKNKLKRLSLMALLFGASAVVVVYLTNYLFGSKKKKKIIKQVVSTEDSEKYQLVDQRPIENNYWYAIIREQILLFLLAILKNKLASYIESADQKGYIEKIVKYIKGIIPKNTLEQTPKGN